MPSICNRYEIIKEINSTSNIKTYLVRLEPIIKEIIPKDINDYVIIKERLQKIKNEIKIYEIIEEKDKLYIVMDNNNEISTKFDDLIKSDELFIQKEAILKGHGKPFNKEEIFDLFKMEKSMCRISFEKLINNEIRQGKGTGFFCELNDFPIKHALFTNNHVLDEYNLRVGNKINIEYYKKSSLIKRKINLDKQRRVFTNKKLDYTCIELFETDGIKDYFQIDPILFQDKNYLNNADIFILQYPRGNELSFSYGKILSLKDNKIIHAASTEEGSSGSPIIRRCKENYIIGLHFGGVKKDGNIEYSFNLATIFDYILFDIKKPIEINCIYIINDNEKEIQLMHDNNKNESYDSKTNIQLFEQNIELYINEKKIKFNYKYNIMDETEEIKVKFIFKQKLNTMSHMFDGCTLLKSIDLSSFNSNNITDMSYMFNNCSRLESIDLSSFNTSNTSNMSYMFYKCSSLKSIELSSFQTRKNTSIEGMLNDCFSLKEKNIILNKKDKRLVNMINKKKKMNECEIKIVFFGDICVGKSAIIDRFCNNNFEKVYPNRHGSYHQKNIELNIELNIDTNIKFHIWDVVGDYHFRSMGKLYYRDALVVLLTYDVTNEESLESLKYWISEVNNNKRILCLVGNKNDVDANEKKVSTSKGKAFAEQHKMMFYEISAKTGSGIKELFRDIAFKAYELNKSECE